MNLKILQSSVSETEASIIKGILESEGIKCTLVLSKQQDAYTSVFGSNSAMRNFDVVVREEDYEKASNLL